MEGLSEKAIQGGLNTRFIGQVARFYSSIPSTMDAARALAQEGAPEGTIVVAVEQTSGRGRLERPWRSPPGGSILLSALLKPSTAEASRLTMVASLAVSQSLEETLGLAAAIKWPNDVLVRGKKIAGILVESHLRDGETAFCIVGIGVNVNFDPALLGDVIYPATTVSAELGRSVPLLPLLQAILERFEDLYLRVKGGWPVHEQWQQRLETIGKQIRVTGIDRVEYGLAEGVTEDGSLILRRSDDTATTILAGDVTLRG